MGAKRQPEWNQYDGAEKDREARKGFLHAKLKHSAIREYSDHLITFQSMFSRVSHQPLKQRKFRVRLSHCEDSLRSMTLTSLMGLVAQTHSIGQHSPKAKCQASPKACSIIHSLNTLRGQEACREMPLGFSTDLHLLQTTSGMSCSTVLCPGQWTSSTAAHPFSQDGHHYPREEQKNLQPRCRRTRAHTAQLFSHL